MVNKLIFVFLIICATCIWNTESSKILMIWAMPAHSHYTLGITLAKGLAEKGHQITFAGPYPSKNLPKNIREIVVPDPIEFAEELKKDLFQMDKKSIFQNINMIMTMGTNLTRLFLENNDIQKLLKSKEHFDAVILETFVNEALFGLGYHFKAPVILVSPGDAQMYGHLLANPAPSSYIPNKSGTFSGNMNFLQRLQNFFSSNLLSSIQYLVSLPQQKKLFNKYISSEIDLEDVMYNASLMLTNSHVSIGLPQPSVPNVIDVGGYHISPPKKLPVDLQKFLDESKDGVILFSMGSNLKSADLKPEVQNAIIQSFSKIKQKILWKFEKELPGLPPNVKIMKWVPQGDVLAHPNVRAFITHGGLLSTIETIYNGVPVIGIPVFGDQKANIAEAVSNGYALSVPLSEITEERLSNALNEIINNPKYRENVKRRSQLWKDRPLSPMDTAIYWIEYVIRYQGASHLRSLALNLKWYQVYMVDIILFLTTVTILLFAIFYIIIKKLLGCLCGKKTEKGESSSKSKRKSKKE